MKRDHLLGFPPVLLALDSEPRKSHGQTPPRAPMSHAEQQARREHDKIETAKLAPAPAPSPVLTEPADYTYYERNTRFRWYRHDGYSSKPDVWNPARKLWHQSDFTLADLLDPDNTYNLVMLGGKPEGVD